MGFMSFATFTMCLDAFQFHVWPCISMDWKELTHMDLLWSSLHRNLSHEIFNCFGVYVECCLILYDFMQYATFQWIAYDTPNDGTNLSKFSNHIFRFLSIYIYEIAKPITVFFEFVEIKNLQRDHQIRWCWK